jgi:hypothetical protein
MAWEMFMKLLLASLVLALAGTESAVAKECRMPDLRPGVRVQLPPGCKDPIKTGVDRADEQSRLRSDAGSIDLGNGTKVKVGGRVRAEVGIRR